MNKSEAYQLAAAIMATSGWTVEEVKPRPQGEQWCVIANRGGDIRRVYSAQEWVELLWRERFTR